nr:hypothetical protein [Lactobacillus nasalidis]
MYRVFGIVFTDFRGVLPAAFNQGPVHGPEAAKAALFSNRLQGPGIGQKELPGRPSPQVAQIGGHGDPHVFLEKAGQVLFGNVSMGRDLA